MLEIIQLPDDPVLHSLSFLNFKDLTNCALTCRRFYQLSLYDRLWKRHCSVCWDENVCPSGVTWKEHFRTWYHEFGRYLNVYRPISKAWNQIENYVEKFCPGIHAALRAGVLDDEIDAFERRYGVTLPLDLRCVYRIHNGQMVHDAIRHNIVYGILGSIKFSRYFASEALLPLHYCKVLTRSDLPSPCISPIRCPDSGMPVFLSLGEALLAEPPGKLFYIFSADGVSPVFDNADEPPSDVYIKGTDFLEYFTSYAQKLSDLEYPSVDGEIIRFDHDKESEAVTDHVRISVATAFMPMMSRIDPPEFVFAYRITISMDTDVHPRYACQLETRQWFITDDDGKVETVKGPGVVGDYPVVKPGSTYSYISCTNFKTQRGTMHGIYTMRKLASGETLDAVVPLFHMQCPPFLQLPGLHPL